MQTRSADGLGNAPRGPIFIHIIRLHFGHIDRGTAQGAQLLQIFIGQWLAFSQQSLAICPGNVMAEDFPLCSREKYWRKLHGFSGNHLKEGNVENRTLEKSSTQNIYV